MMLSELFHLHLLLPSADIVAGTCAYRWYRQIKTMNEWSAEEIKKWQIERLHHTVLQAYEHTKYYKCLFDNLGVSPCDIRTFDDLKYIPIITKSIIREHFFDLVADNVSEKAKRLCKTGGSSGSPMPFYCDEQLWGYITASKIYNWRATGYRYGDAFAALGSSSILSKKPSFVRRVYDMIRREYGLNSVNMDDSVCKRHVEFIRKKHICFLYGYASAIYLFACYVIRMQIKLPIVAIFTTAENLTDEYRKTIMDAFHCRIMDSYGARDAGITAFEDLEGMYPVSYNTFVEVVDEISPNTGTLLSTNLLNDSFPLLRYDFGDIATLACEEVCKKYNGQVITNIIGRKSDVISLSNGHVLTGPGFNSIFSLFDFDVLAYQVEQTSSGGVVIHIQKGAGYDDRQASMLLDEFRKYVGEGVDCAVEYVDDFPLLPSGKQHCYFVRQNTAV